MKVRHLTALKLAAVIVVALRLRPFLVKSLILHRNFLKQTNS
jgi:hypothetical protein